MILDFGNANDSNGTYSEDGYVFTETGSQGFDIEPDNEAGGNDGESELELHGDGGNDSFTLMRADGQPFDFLRFDLEVNELDSNEDVTIIGLDGERRSHPRCQPDHHRPYSNRHDHAAGGFRRGQQG